MSQRPQGNETYDVVVIGSGAGGMSTAITAKKNNLSVAIIEKEPVFGGTTAFSGGVLWIPGNRHAKIHRLLTSPGHLFGQITRHQKTRRKHLVTVQQGHDDQVMRIGGKNHRNGAQQQGGRDKG